MVEFLGSSPSNKLVKSTSNYSYISIIVHFYSSV